MKLSQQAWKLTAEIVSSIKQHPFNQRLLDGTLPKDIFSYYIAQDTYYIEDFSRSHAILAAKVEKDYIIEFLDYAKSTLITEKKSVHDFFKEKFNIDNNKNISPSLLGYTSHMLRTVLLDPVEVGIACLLPCFWIYQEVGSFIQQSSSSNNPYSQWIEAYSDIDFKNSVKRLIYIFDEVAYDSHDKIRQAMLDAFYKSACLEWHFWNDAYHKTSLEPRNKMDLGIAL